MAILLIALPRYVVHTQRILRARGLSGIVLVLVYVVYKGKSEWKPVKAYCICSWCHESLWAELQYSRRCTQVWRPSG